VHAVQVNCFGLSEGSNCWSGVLLEKLIVPQLIKKFTALVELEISSLCS